jgi:hypothetical protein
MEKYLQWAYCCWQKESNGLCLAVYMITQKNMDDVDVDHLERTYVFPSEDDIYAKADEIFAVFSQTPQRIFVHTSCVVLHFYPRVFVTHKDRQLRDQLFRWIIDRTKMIV